MKFFKKLFGTGTSEWENPKKGDCVFITEEDILSVLDEISASYLKLDGNRLGKILAVDAVIEVKKYVDASFTDHRYDRYAFISSLYLYKRTRSIFNSYRMTIAQEIQSDPDKWVVDCLAEYQLTTPDSTVTKHKSNQRLEFGIQDGWVVVKRAEIVIAV